MTHFTDSLTDEQIAAGMARLLDALAKIPGGKRPAGGIDEGDDPVTTEWVTFQELTAYVDGRRVRLRVQKRDGCTRTVIG